MKNHENGPGTMKNHGNPPGTMKNQPGTMKNYEKPQLTFEMSDERQMNVTDRHFSSLTRGHN